MITKLYLTNEQTGNPVRIQHCDGYDWILYTEDLPDNALVVLLKHNLGVYVSKGEAVFLSDIYPCMDDLLSDLEGLIPDWHTPQTLLL
jgi:hypothetical protein